MAGIFGNSAPASSIERISSFVVQSSAYGNVIPIGWGRGRVAINLLWLDGFFAKKHVDQNNQGKGGDTSDTFTWEYFADVILGICDTKIQPIDRVLRVFRDQEVLDTPAKAGFAGTALGASGQAYWSYLDAYDDDVRIGYDTIAYLFAPAYQLSASATLQNHSCEVQFTTPPGLTIDDNPGSRANREGIISSFLKNCIPQWKPENIGNLYPLGIACFAQGLLISPVLDSPQQASAVLDEWLTACNARCWVRGDGTLQIMPLADEPVTGQSDVTYTPDMTPVYDLDDNDFVVTSPEDDPLKIDAEQLDDIWNVRPVTFKDRDHQYDDNTVTANDQASIDEFGERKANPTSLPCVKKGEVARLVAQLLVQQSANYARPFVFSLPWWADRLEEMDLVTVSSASMELDRVLVRITAIDEDEENGVLTFHATEVLLGTGTAAAYAVQHAEGDGVDHGGDGSGDGNGKHQIFFNPPLTLTNGQNEVWSAVNSLDPTFGGVEYHVGLDSNSFDYYGRGDLLKATFGAIAASLTAHADFDESNVLDVDLSNSQGALLSSTPAQFEAAVRLCWVNGELIAYRQAELTSAYHYRLTGLRRGLYGTQPQSHSVGSPFVLLDDQIFKLPYRDEQLGKTIHVKTLTFNRFGRNVQKLEDVEDEQVLLIPQAVALEAVTGLTADSLALATLVAPVSVTAFWRLVLTISCAAPRQVGLRARFQYQGPTATRWQDCSPTPDQFTQDAQLLTESGTYSVRARYESADGKIVGPWAYTTASVPLPADLLTTDGGSTPVTDDGGAPDTVT